MKKGCLKNLFIMLNLTTVCFFISAVAAGAFTLHAGIQYRDYGGSNSSHTRMYAMFTDDSGNYVDANLSNVQVTYLGSDIEFNAANFEYYALQGSYDESTGQWQFADSLSHEYYTRITISPSADLPDVVAPSGTYSLTIDADGGPYTADIDFAGKQELPRIDSTTFQFSYNLDGDLTISWTLPDQNQFPVGTRLSLVVEDASDWTMAGYFSMPTTVNSITIPSSSMALMGNPDSINVTMRTGSQDHTNRAYSNTATVETSAIEVNTEIDDGYVIGSDLWLKAILQVAGSPVTLVWKEVGTDTTPSGDTVVSGYFYADPDDFAYGSVYNPEVFVKAYIAANGWCNIAFNHVTVDDVTVSSAHSYNGAADQTGMARLEGRLVEHQYDGVGLQ